MVENTDTRQQPVSLNLIALAEATRVYIECIKAALPVIVAMGERGAFVLDLANDALRETEPGTPASIAAALRES